MSKRHAASLLPKWHHDPALLNLMKSPLTSDIVGHIADKAIQVIRCKADPVTGLTTPPTTPVREGSDEPLPPLENFIKSLVRKSKCHIPTLLCTLVYLDRLKFRLPPRSTGSPSTRHRVFLATLIVAAKYLNDSSPQNKHWQRYAVHFSLEEIEVMERQLLALLDFDLRIDEAELLAHFAPFLPEHQESAEAAYLSPPSASSSLLAPVTDADLHRPKSARGPRSTSDDEVMSSGVVGGRLLTPSYSQPELRSSSPSSPKKRAARSSSLSRCASESSLSQQRQIVPSTPPRRPSRSPKRPPPRPARSPDRVTRSSSSSRPVSVSWSPPQDSDDDQDANSEHEHHLAHCASYMSESSASSTSGPRTPFDAHSSPLLMVERSSSSESLSAPMPAFRRISHAHAGFSKLMQAAGVALNKQSNRSASLHYPFDADGAGLLPSPPPSSSDGSDRRGDAPEMETGRRLGFELMDKDRVAMRGGRHGSLSSSTNKRDGVVF